MNKEIKAVIEDQFKNGKPKNDFQLEMAINQGYVPPKCLLLGGLVMALINSGEDPCKGCHMDRVKCGGRPY